MHLELPLNDPIDTNTPHPALELGRDFYAKFFFLAYSHCVLDNLTQVVFSLCIYAKLSSIITLHYKSCATFHLIKLFHVHLSAPTVSIKYKAKLASVTEVDGLNTITLTDRYLQIALKVRGSVSKNSDQFQNLFNMTK